MTPEDLTDETDEDTADMRWQTLRANERFGPLEQVFRHRSEGPFPVMVSGVRVLDADNRPMIWSIIEDISAQKRVERLKNEFVSTVSHELRTPLTSIGGSLKLIDSGVMGELPNAIGDLISIASRNAQRLAWLVDDLLDMDKLLSGQMRFEMRPEALTPLLEASLDHNRGYADQYGIALTLQADGEARARVDAGRLDQVIGNLVSNAIKYSPAGGEVRLRLSTRNGRARIEVEDEDEGDGIAPEFRPRLFQRFAQADATDTRRDGGTGLGLAISHQLVSRMNGRIGLDADYTEGARFYVELPLASASD